MIFSYLWKYVGSTLFPLQAPSELQDWPLGHSLDVVHSERESFRKIKTYECTFLAIITDTLRYSAYLVFVLPKYYLGT